MRIRRKRHFQNSKYVLELFFNFYTLISLDFYAGKRGIAINHTNKAERITALTKSVIDEIYTHAREALEISCRQEARHAYSECDIYSGPSKWAKEWEERNNLSFKSNAPKMLTIDQIYNLFSMDGWDDDYGGEAWATATKFLFENPSTYQEKISWVDRVFDHEHNNGNILDKTDFGALSRKKYFEKSKFTMIPLNFRFRSGLVDLAENASGRVYKLTMANLNKVPENAWRFKKPALQSLA